MLCPACNAENEAAHESCFSCGQRLVGPPPLTRGSLIAGGRYEILGALGRGGMGMVYKAHDRKLEETVALKVLRPDIAQAPDLARRFRSEIKLARRVTHANVCRIHNYDEDGALGYIVMEIVEGLDLKQLRVRQGPLSTAQAFEASAQMADGLQAIHDAGVVHRDLKTSNVMLDAQGKIKLMDFGIAKQVSSGATMGATAMGHVVGTPEYMSPEQARGLKLDYRSDLYSLGIVIYEIFTGHVPFRGDTPIATIYLSLEQPPPLEGPEAEGIPPALVPVLTKALAKDPRDRFDSASEMAAALRAARQQSLPASPATVALPAPPPGGRPDATGTTALPPLETVAHSSPRLPSPVTPAPAPTPPPLHRATPTPSPTPAPIPPPPPAPSPTPSQARKPVPEPTQRRPAQRRPAQRPVLPWLVFGAALLVVAVASLVMLVKQVLDGQRDTRVADTIAPTPSPLPTPVTTTTRPPAPTTTVPTTSTTTTTPTTTTTTSTTTTTAPRPSPSPSATAPAAAVGLLQLVVKPWAEVSVDDQVVGTTPLQPVRLKPGTHTVRLTHPAYRPLQRKLTIEAGKTERLEIDWKLDGIALRQEKR